MVGIGVQLGELSILEGRLETLDKLLARRLRDDAELLLALSLLVKFSRTSLDLDLLRATWFCTVILDGALIGRVGPSGGIVDAFTLSLIRSGSKRLIDVRTHVCRSPPPPPLEPELVVLLVAMWSITTPGCWR